MHVRILRPDHKQNDFIVLYSSHKMYWSSCPLAFLFFLKRNAFRREDATYHSCTDPLGVDFSDPHMHEHIYVPSTATLFSI